MFIMLIVYMLGMSVCTHCGTMRSCYVSFRGIVVKIKVSFMRITSMIRRVFSASRWGIHTETNRTFMAFRPHSLNICAAMLSRFVVVHVRCFSMCGGRFIKF